MRPARHRPGPLECSGSITSGKAEELPGGSFSFLSGDMDEGKLLSPQEKRVLQDLEKIKRSVDAAGFHFGHTAQPEGVYGAPSIAAAPYYYGNLLTNLDEAQVFPGVGAAATPFTASGAPAGVEATQEQEDVLLRENDGNLSHQLPQHSVGGSRQSAVHSNIFLSDVPIEGVEAAEEQISAVRSQQSAVPVQISIISGLFTATGAIITLNISRSRSDPAAARILGLVAIGFAVGALLTTAYCIIFVWERFQDAVAATARPAPGHPYRTLTWLFYIGWILWGISLFVTLAAYIV